MFDFAQYFKNLDYFAIIDLIVLGAAVTLLTMFFVHKRQVKLLLIYLSVAAAAVIINVGAGLSGREILTVSRAVFYLALIFMTVGMVFVYQTDIKSLFQKISNPHTTDLYSSGYGSDEELKHATAEILTACQNMAKQDMGAIIVIEGATRIPSTIHETGTMLNAQLSAPLIESIFNTNSPLHDGAIIIRGNKILSAGCFLPLTQKLVNKEMGTRHRAAIGVTEETNALAIVVSEETGIISTVRNGDIKRYMTMDKLKDEIERSYGIGAFEQNKNNNKNRRIFRR